MEYTYLDINLLCYTAVSSGVYAIPSWSAPVHR